MKLPTLELIEIPDKEIFTEGIKTVGEALNLYQGDLFLGYIVKGFYRDDSRKYNHFLVYKNPGQG